MARDPNLGESLREKTQRQAREAQAAIVQKPQSTKPQNQQTVSQSKNFRYPLDAIYEKTDFIRLSVVKYVSPGIGLQNQGTSTLTASATNPFNTRTSNSEETNSGYDRRRIKERTIARFDLPMPAQLADGNSVAWSKGDMNTIAAVVGAFAGKLMENKDKSLNPADFMNNLITGLQGLGQAASSAGMGGLMQVGKGALVSLMVNKIPYTGQFGFEDYLARQGGVVINPNAEFLFKGPQLRQFAFAFTFVPRNKQEGQMVAEIIRNLKIHMSPKSSVTNFGTGNKLLGGFLQAPDIFKIEYRTGINPHPFLNKFKYCALTDLKINYAGGNGYMSYEDGTPIVTTIAMQFNELTPIYAEDYERDYAKGGVGY